MLGMHIIAIDGESKTSKTTLMNGIADHFDRSPDIGLVLRADAGRFFRALTHEALALIGADHAAAPPDMNGVHDAVFEAIRRGDAFRPDRDRGDLDRPIIEQLVSKVARLEAVQQAGVAWCGETVANSRHADALIVNGRNPVDRMAEKIIEYGLAVDLTVLAVCDTATAANRVVHADKTGQLTHEQAELAVIGRRDSDTNREIFPYREPTSSVPFALDGLSPADTVLLARERGVDERFPAAVRFDTAAYPKDVMIEHAVGLATAALATSARL